MPSTRRSSLYRTASSALKPGKKGRVLREHVRDWFLDPLKEDRTRHSEFAERTSFLSKVLKKVPRVGWRVLDFPLIAGIRLTRRNILAYEKGGKVVAHVAFQRHGKTMHVFHVWVTPTQRRQGLGKRAILDFIEFARGKGMKSVRLGAGGDERVNAFFRYISSHVNDFRVTPRAGNWLDFI